ncbi:MAG: 3-oxoacyl-ACP reductase [Cupriavidus sp.]|jgi:3-oxoacyl-[acyl-carrier protein] reductase|uniref:SDR family oxidoreductase n=1 Tax=Cupriavidus pauculus TaxID=82633 RepID=UPI0007832E55|nr:SDR family oxidoreductase [Cupriavidus pauculus]MBU68188.1 3-oxoacyl-ACP reductase [Cupriavidus sp.]KAB0604651.1 SDR family oxidoreductase [Cupriavidus pauculus]MBY4729859.1 SDR family oxidoreductase [Cupriavidus pauculus]MCM3607076.1 SDR family oxidoreductase [Cupriavidus pauculus]UAK98913.1 SDR family oxidoreductase [Cupriavidus pauculus]
MDFGLRGKHALVCGASKGLGFACADALAAEGVDVVVVARGAEALEKAAADLRARHGRRVVAVATDITTPEGRKLALDAAAKLGDLDILVNNAGGPPPGNFRDWGRDEWIAALDANMLTPIELIKATVDGMIARRWGRIINITSGAVKAPIDVLGLSNGARAGLTGFVAGLAREVAQYGVTVNNLLPGPFDTDRLKKTMEGGAKKAGISIEEMAARRAAANPSRRFGEPAEFGATCAFLCSKQAAYMTGQNVLLDGGAYPGTF